MIYNVVVDICHCKEVGWRPRIPGQIVGIQAHRNVGKVSCVSAFPEKIKDGVTV